MATRKKKVVAPGKKDGRPAHKPTDANRAKVEALCGFGAPESYIAREIGVGEKTLRKYYRDQLDFGMMKANAAVAQSLYKKATGDGPQSAACAIFWAKTRMGWKETQAHEHTGPDGGAILFQTVYDASKDH